MNIRPLRDGDDTTLNEIFHDPETPAGHMLRGLLRPGADDSTGNPILRSVVAVLPGADVPVAAGALAVNSVHPYRAWTYVEVAPTETGRGIGTEILRALQTEVQGTAMENLPLRTRVEPHSAGYDWAIKHGFRELFATRVIRIEAGALGAAGVNRIEDVEVTSSGSVALTKAFAAWYRHVNSLDQPGELSLGQYNAAFLSEAAGAHGGALLWSQENDGKRFVSAFAVSYARPNVDEPTELLLGSSYETADMTPESVPEAAITDMRALVARLSVETPVVVEVTPAMPVVKTVVDELLARGTASVLYDYATLVSS